MGASTDYGASPAQPNPTTIAAKTQDYLVPNGPGQAGLLFVPKRHHNGSNPNSRSHPVPTNLTLKGIPDEVYARLKASASVNHRSLNSEIIARLEAQVLPRRSTTEQLAAIRATRDRLTKASFDHDLVDRSKREGRA
jgi:antitoxin FitA